MSNDYSSFTLGMYVCRPIVLQHGLWDQVHVDCGREFALLLYVQDWLSSFRTNTQRAPYVQTQSKQVWYTVWTCQLCGLEWMPCCLSIPMQNHLAERHWVEVNTRVNYPVKTALTWMQQNNYGDRHWLPSYQILCVFDGWKLRQVGIQLHIRAWNSHRIPGKHCEHVLQIHAHSNANLVIV